MELPRLEPLYQKYRDQGLAILAVEAFRDTDGAKEFIEEHGLTYTLLENGEEEEEVVREIMGVNVFPTSFLVNEQGRILYAHIGFDEGDEAKLEKEIQDLLAD